MKHKRRTGMVVPMPTEEEIREYAHLLYIQSGWLPGRDLDNWLEAEAHLIARAQERMHGSQRAVASREHAIGV